MLYKSEFKLPMKYPTCYFQDTQNVVQLGFRMEEMVFNMADTHFFFNDIEVVISTVMCRVIHVVYFRTVIKYI